MVNAANNSTVNLLYETNNTFLVFYENDFLVLPDAKTVVGADESDNKQLIMEDITQGDTTQIGTHSGFIQTLVFDKLTETLLVGDESGRVKQYKKIKKSTFFGFLKESDSFTLVKDYKDIGVGQVLSSAQIGGLAIFGGANHSIIAIDISKQRLCTGVIKSPFEDTYSLVVCHSADSNVYLSIGGSDPKYSSNVSDYLDVTRLHNRSKNKPGQSPEEINQLVTLLQEKDEIINTLKLKRKQLQADLLKQRKQHQGTANQKSLKTKSTRFSRRTSHSNQKTKHCHID